MWATMKGRYNTVKHILSIDLIEVNNQDIDGWTALHHAAKLGNDHIMELLIKNGADATYKNREGHTPFWLLLKARQGGEKVDAIWNPSQISNIFRLFPDPDFKDQDERTLLSWAAEYGDWEMVEALLQNNANPNNRDPETHPRNVPHSLNELESRTQSTFRKTPLIWALENRRERAIEMLKSIDKGTLHLLLRESDIIGEKNALEMVHTLINRGYNINQADAEGKTPLHVASTIDNEDFASALILGKANLERQDNSRKTPLQCAFREKRKNIIRVLLDHGADITPIQSVEWLSLGSNKSHYAQITRKGRKQQYSMLPTPAKDNMTWVPRAGEYRLSLHSKQDIYWSRLCHEHHFRRFRSDYVCYGFLNSNSLPEGFIASRMAVSFPSELGINPGRTQSFWGIEWAVNQSTTGFAYGFISTLSTSRVPESISDFCQQFLRELVEEWDKICSKGIQDIEGIRSHQLKLRGRSRRLIDDLARNSLKRAELRRCLQQQVSGLQKAVDDSTTIKIDEKKQLANRIENMKKSVASQLDDMERAIRELLQIELAWVTIGETASMKRLSWVTFIFLPLMFVSSLFGMNVDILQNNPDWRWYILCSTLCLLSTVAIWVSFKFLNIESWSEARRFSPLHKRTVKYKGHADV
ncbi:ankyrin repeat-containing domain protein [Aspergillus bertholletiae]|uniref:Ankyrin repeat-containing domain protein n=1 Tax=Aspergillus bertholletiae TaxID=1226010 RepID=A0A5N7B3E6_9EURO|nr:ankyrin repeat-containing domain protein [Aspergillus bertholletiae]